MLSVRSRRKAARIFLIEGVTDDDFSGTVRSTLLEMVTASDPFVIVAFSTCMLRAVRMLAVDGDGIPTESSQDNFFVRKDLREDQGRMKQKKEQGQRETPAKGLKLSKHTDPLLKLFLITASFLGAPILPLIESVSRI